MADRNIKTTLTLEDRLSPGLKTASNNVNRFTSDGSAGANALNGHMGNLGGTLRVLGGIAAGIGLGAMFTSAVSQGVKFNSIVENATIGFTTMLGSGEAAKKFLDDLAAFAVKTPFEFPELIQAAQRMKAYGFATEDVIPTLTAVGDATAALGGSQEVLDRIVMAFGQIKAKGKLSGEEVRQLAEAGIPVWDILAETMGKSTAELIDMSEKGLIPADVAIKSLTDGMEKRFPGMMNKMSTTFTGLMSNIKDAVNITWGTAIKPFFDYFTTEALKPVAAGLAKVQEFFKKIRDDIEGKPPQVQVQMMIDRVSDKLSQMINDNWAAIIEQGHRIGQALGEGIGKALSAEATWVKGMWDGKQSGVTAKGEELGGSFLSGFGTGVNKNVGTLDAIGMSIGAVLGLAIGKSPTAAAAGAAIGPALVNNIKTSVERIAAGGDTGLATAIAWFLVGPILAPLISGRITTIMNTVKTTLATQGPSMFAGLQTTITTFFQSLPTRIAAFLAGLPAMVGYWFGFLGTTAIAQLQLLGGNIMVFLSTLPGIFTDWLGQAATSAAAGAGFVLGSIVQFISQIPANIEAFLAAIPGYIQGLWEQARAFTAGAWNGIRDAIANTTNSLPGLISNAFENIKDYLSGLPGELGAYANDIATSFWENFKDGLGIHSPSYVERAFMRMGDASKDAVNVIGDNLNGLAIPGFTVPVSVGSGQATSSGAVSVSFGNVTVDSSQRVDELVNKISQALGRQGQLAARGVY